MSGLMNSGVEDARYQAMIERIQQNHSRLPSNSLYESRIAPSIIDSSQQTFNPLSTQRFYAGSNANSTNHFPAEVTTNALSNAVSSAYPLSNVSEFRMPQTTKQFSEWMENKSIIDQFVQGLGAFDKSRQKLVRRLVVHSFRTFEENPQTVNSSVSPSILLDQIYNAVKTNYYSNNQIPKSLSGSSLMSDRTINFHQQPRVILERNITQRPTSTVTSMTLTSRPGRSAVNSTITANEGQSEQPSCRQKNNISSVLEESPVCLFDNSMLQHQRDERAARQCQPPPAFAEPKTKTARAKPLPKPKLNTSVRAKPTSRPKLNASKTTKTASERAKEADTSNALKGKSPDLDIFDNTPLPAGIKALSRTGRMIKSPVKFYKVTNETTVYNSGLGTKKKQSRQEDDNSILNGSMTLRNKKVVDKITPPLKSGKDSKKNTPLSTLFENRSLVLHVKKSAAKKTSNKEDKENSVAPKNKTTKKQTSSGNKNSNSKSSRGTACINKKAEIVKEVKKTAPKKVTKKRKSVGEDENISKKKKTEEKQQQPNLIDEAIDSDDELLGITYRKTTQSTLKAVSPSTGLLSVKKAAAGNVCKETPPCKTMGTLMSTSVCSAPNSSVGAKEVPLTKPTHVKRVAKTLLKGPNKTKAKSSRPKKGEKKEDPELQKMLDAVKSSYSVTTPTSVIKYTNMVFGQKKASDSSDFDSGDDGDNDDDDDDDLF